jgi:hypothetical protein
MADREMVTNSTAMGQLDAHEASPEMRQTIFPGLVVPDGLTFEDLERAGEMILEWQGDGWSSSEDYDDFRAVRLAAKLCEYFRVAASNGTCERTRTG